MTRAALTKQVAFARKFLDRVDARLAVDVDPSDMLLEAWTCLHHAIDIAEEIKWGRRRLLDAPREKPERGAESTGVYQVYMVPDAPPQIQTIDEKGMEK